MTTVPFGANVESERLMEQLGRRQGIPLVARILWSDLPTCRSCENLPSCVRCHANALHEDGDLLGPSRLAWRTARVRARLWAAEHPSGLAVAGESRRLASAGTAAGAAEGSRASTGR